jgi:SET domain
LAVLCHEHAATRKLPDLDQEISFQNAVERKAEAIVSTTLRDNCRSHHKVVPGRQLTDGDNVFFRGIQGSNATSYELRLLEALVSANVGAGAVAAPKQCRNNDKRLSFCLPCDIKEEVHSKPPGYKHVSVLQYQPGNKPPRLPLPGDVCGCIGSCGDNCINRTLYTECFGEAAMQLTNCSVGAGCGNRQLGQRKTAKCKPAREEGRGWGLAALQKISSSDLVVEYVGEVIDEKTKEQRLKEWSKEHPNDTNFYIMALQPNWYIDARLVANTARFVNHSCDPNCILLPINVNGWSRCGIFALRDIELGEFLSYDYHFETQQTDKFICCCGALNCRGTMNHNKSLSRVSNVGDDWEVAKAEYHRDVKFLESREMNNVTSLVGAHVPTTDEACTCGATPPNLPAPECCHWLRLVGTAAGR